MTDAAPHAVVTGATSGIGAAITAWLLREGWHVTGLSRNAPAVLPPGYAHRSVDLLDRAATLAALDGLAPTASTSETYFWASPTATVLLCGPCKQEVGLD